MPMPSCSAASMIRRFFGTATVSPFNVMVTVSFRSFANDILRPVPDRCRSDGDRHGLRAADQGQVLVLELLDRARDGRCSRIAQHADRGPRHVPTQLEQLVEI